MQPLSDLSILGVISLGAFLGGVGSVITNFLLEVYKAKTTLNNDIIKKRHELRDLRRIDAYEKLYRELRKATLLQPNDTSAILAQVDVIETFLDDNMLYFEHEEKSLVYACTNYFKNVANPAANFTKNIATEELHLEIIAKRFIEYK